MKKIKEVKCKNWVPLKLEGAILSGDFDGLIGVEELTDYELDSNSKKRRNKDDTFENKVAVKKKKTSQARKKNTNELKFRNNKEKHLLQVECKSEDVIDIKDDESSINIEAWKTLGVPSVIIKALTDEHFVSPTLIQSLTLAPAILGRKDILGAAETGSGKTLAFGIPIINGILKLKKKEEESVYSKNSIFTESDEDKNTVQKINISKINSTKRNVDIDSSSEEEYDELSNENMGCVQVINKVIINDVYAVQKKPLYALILTPTRELAIQIKNHLSKAAKYTDLKIAVVVGGMAAVKQERILSKGPEIVIATPGRLWELISEGNLHLSQLNSIKYLAIDETDRMLEKGHFQELHTILERINVDESKIQERQTFVFSATLTLVHDIPQYLQRKKKRSFKSKIFKLTPGQKLQNVIDMLRMKSPKIVDITKEKGTAGSLTECRITCTIDHKDYYLYYFLKRHVGRTLVFCNSIGCVKRLATLFNILDCNPLQLHANMIQRQRLKNLERFQEDNNGLLIATDVAARGLDIPNVEHVIHYQVPRTSESYVHRSGRTARAQKEGITIILMEPSEKQFYTRLCKTLGRSHDLPTFPTIDRLLIAVKERVNVAREIDKLELRCKRDNVQKDWLRKAVEDMDLILDDDQKESTLEDKETAELRRKLKIKKHHLSTLLMKPLFPKGFSGKYIDTNMDLMLDQNSQKAVDVMKQVINEYPKKTKCKSLINDLKKNRATLKQKLKNERRVKKKREKKNKQKLLQE